MCVYVCVCLHVCVSVCVVRLSQVTTSRKYSDRLETLANVRDAGISVCAGGIIGLGEGEKDRVGLIHQLATLPEHPESVPINRLVAIKVSSTVQYATCAGIVRDATKT